MLLYNIGIIIYSLLIKIASFRVEKARQWCEGREDLFERMAEAIAPIDRVIWVHIASLGEFEQGRPLIEKIRATHPEYKILLTFFSPSGYEIRKNYEGADYIFYLPIDTTSNARKFLDIVHPEMAIFVKYEYWLNLLFELRNRDIKSYIVSSIFRKESIFFKWWGFMWRNALESFNVLFVQDNNSKELLANIGFDNVIVAGDTRFDRVIDIAKSAKSIDIVEQFKGDKELLVAGSTWQPDEQILESIISRHKDVKFVIAPHEIHEEHIAQIEALMGSRAVRYNKVADKSVSESALISAQVLILDTMGMLSSLYQYGNWAYIGGGFGVGIHNTLEAATFALPIAFGPNYHKFKEAVDMIESGACRSINNAEELEAWFSPLINDKKLRAKSSQAAKDYTASRSGATESITRTIFSK